MKNWKKLLSAVLALSLAVPGAAMPAQVQAEEANLALQGTATASSYETAGFEGSKAADGSMDTRWGTGVNKAENEWLQVSLQKEAVISRIVINFERADDAQNILGYHVEIDGETVYTKTEKAAQVETITFDTAEEGQVVKLVIDEADGGKMNYVNVGVSELQIFGEYAEGEEADETIEATADVNHIRTAVLTASSAEIQNFDGTKAGDGDEGTRWSSDGQGASEEWLKATFAKPTQIKHIKVKLFTRNAAPTPSNLEQLSIKYTDAEGNTKYAKENCANAKDGQGFSTYMSIVLEEAIVAKDIQLCDFVANAAEWNNIGITEFEAYSNEQTEPVDPLDGITVETPEPGDTKLVVNIPEVEGCTTAYNGTDYEQVVGADLTIYEPIVDTTVKVSFKSVSDTNEKDYEFKEIEVTIPGTYTQEEGDNEAPAVLPELREWKGYTGDFTVAEKAKVVVASEELLQVAEIFAADYEDLSGKKMEVVTGTLESVKEGEFFFTFTDESKGLDEEGYLMEIKDIVTVEAEEATGAMWATRTILQALKTNDMTTMPQGITRDYPLYKVRGLILDVGRKTFTMDYLQQVVKQMSWYKLNDFHVHLNDNYIFLENYTNSGRDPMSAYSGFRLESDIKAGDTVVLNGKEFTYKADLTNTDVFYTKDEFRNFIKESDVYGVNIVPEFDAPAHSLSFTKVLPELRTGTSGRQNDHLDLASQYDECYDFITNVFDEYLLGDDPVFTQDTVVHFGADEYTAAPNKFREFCNDMADYVESTGRTARVWGSLTTIKGDGSVEVDGTGIQMNLWNFGYANMDEMYESGFDLIDCNDGQYYIVPNAGYYGDYLGANVMYNDAPNSISHVTIPAGDKQMIGAAYAIWNDMIDEKDNGMSEYDIYKRLANNMGLFAAKMWGKGDLEMKEAQKIEKFMGDAPNTDFHYAVECDAEGNILHWSEEDFAEMGSNHMGLIVEEGSESEFVVKLSGDDSYVQTLAGTLGLGNNLTVRLKRTSESTEEQILFESEYGSIKAVQKDTGKVGISRENYDYSFDYELPVGEWVEISIRNEFEVVSLYVNGELTDTIGDGEKVGDRPLRATCMLPLEYIGVKDKNNGFVGFIDYISVTTEPEVEYYDYNKVKVTASSEEVDREDAAADYVSDGDESTFWHSQWSAPNAQPPHWIQLELADVETLDQFVYLPRQNGTNGIFTGYELEVSTDGENWTLISEGSWENSATEKVVDFEPVEAKYVKLTATSSVGNYGSAAEVKLHVYVPQETTEEVCKVFTDVPHGAWYEGYVQYVYDNGLMAGSNGLFNPTKNVTRAQLVTTLYRLADEPEVTDRKALTEFTDVADGLYYTDAVCWAYNIGVGTGNDGKFNPTGNLTRQQMAAFLYRFAGIMGYDTTQRGDYSAMINADQVSEYAEEAVSWAVGAGLISGSEVTNADGSVSYDLKPRGNTTRAQLAAILQRFCEGTK